MEKQIICAWALALIELGALLEHGDHLGTRCHMGWLPNKGLFVSVRYISEHLGINQPPKTVFVKMVGN